MPVVRQTCPRVERGIADALAAGVQGTSGFVIGLTKTGAVIETPVRGAQPIDTFRQIIERALASSSGARP
jgi:protein-disulfide isomerase